MIQTPLKEKIFSVASLFLLDSIPAEVEECTVGHINSTYFVTCENGEKYVLQNINTGIFKNPDGLMDNVVGVTEHIRKKLAEEGGDTERGTLNFCRAHNGKYFVFDDDGRCWRMYRFIDRVLNLQTAGSGEIFARVGRAFGHFQMQLADYDASVLCETIPNFHNTVSRYLDFEKAVSDDAAGRAGNVEKEIAFVREHKGLCSYIIDRISSGVLPLRVTHNDTKLNNILIDEESGQPLCVIDLDTIMPGSVLYDFGDAIRFGASSAAEDETDLEKVYMRTEMFDAFASGFIAGLDGSLSEEEILDLPMGAVIITLETGIRFLTDYLNGDTYFRTGYPEHNLDRARNQFKLVSYMEENLSVMNGIVRKYL